MTSFSGLEYQLTRDNHYVVTEQQRCQWRVETDGVSAAAQCAQIRAGADPSGGHSEPHPSTPSHSVEPWPASSPDGPGAVSATFTYYPWTLSKAGTTQPGYGLPNSPWRRLSGGWSENGGNLCPDWGPAYDERDQNGDTTSVPQPDGVSRPPPRMQATASRRGDIGSMGQSSVTFESAEGSVSDCLSQPYACGNPAIELIDGAVYFYSAAKTKQLLQMVDRDGPKVSPPSMDELTSVNVSSIVLVVPDVPLSLGSAEFVQSLYECTDAAKGLDLVKVLRGVSDTSYPILLFVQPKAAWSFFLHLTAQSDIVGYTVHLVKGLTAKVESTQQALGEGRFSSDRMKSGSLEDSSSSSNSSTSARSSSSYIAKPLAFINRPLSGTGKASLTAGRLLDAAPIHFDIGDLPTVREALASTPSNSSTRSSLESDSSFLRLTEEMAALDWASRSSGGWSGYDGRQCRPHCGAAEGRASGSFMADGSGSTSKVTDPACLPYSMSDSDLFLNDVLERRWSLLGDEDGSDIPDERIDRSALSAGLHGLAGLNDPKCAGAPEGKQARVSIGAAGTAGNQPSPRHNAAAGPLLSPSFLLRRCDFPVNCAVCLERVTWQSDAVGRRENCQGVDGAGSGSPLAGSDEKPLGVAINIVCGHSFHSGCLLRWWDNSCPVCRHQQHLGKTPNCKHCGGHDALFCLSCGFVGCGGDDLGRDKLWEDEDDKEGEFTSDEEKNKVYSPSYQHFLMSNHIYALELMTYRIWDHWKQCYVGSFSQLAAHGPRGLLQAQPTPAETEVADAQRLQTSDRSAGIVSDDKANLEGVPAAFHVILQRLRADQDAVFAAEEASLVEFLERRKQEATQSADAARKKLDATKQEAMSLKEQLEAIEAEHSSLLAARQQVIARNRALEELRKRLTEQADANTLRENETRSRYQQEIKAKSAIVAELTSQIADLAFHIKAQERLAEIPDLQDATVEAVQRPARRLRRRR